MSEQKSAKHLQILSIYLLTYPIQTAFEVMINDWDSTSIIIYVGNICYGHISMLRLDTVFQRYLKPVHLEKNNERRLTSLATLDVIIHSG